MRSMAAVAKRSAGCRPGPGGCFDGFPEAIRQDRGVPPKVELGEDQLAPCSPEPAPEVRIAGQTFEAWAYSAVIGAWGTSLGDAQ